jgi:hypothetical protein
MQVLLLQATLNSYKSHLGMKLYQAGRIAYEVEILRERAIMLCYTYISYVKFVFITNLMHICFIL